MASEEETCLSTADQATVIQAQLRLRLAQSEVDVARARLDLASERALVELGRYKALVVSLGERYEFDPDKCEMDPDTGRIIPRGTLLR